METRGPGEYLGARQSGWPELKVANVGDRDLLALARADAADLLASDPNLDRPCPRGFVERSNPQNADYAVRYFLRGGGASLIRYDKFAG